MSFPLPTPWSCLPLATNLSFSANFLVSLACATSAHLIHSPTFQSSLVKGTSFPYWQNPWDKQIKVTAQDVLITWVWHCACVSPLTLMFHALGQTWSPWIFETLQALTSTMSFFDELLSTYVFLLLLHIIVSFVPTVPLWVLCLRYYPSSTTSALQWHLWSYLLALDTWSQILIFGPNLSHEVSEFLGKGKSTQGPAMRKLEDSGRPK